MAMTEASSQSAALSVEKSALPRHVAIIMDGNGRWAEARGLPRVEGHRQGLATLRKIVSHAGDRGIEFLTLYSFSSENWRRPIAEVSFLMGLLQRFVQKDLSELCSANVRVSVIGERDSLAPDIRQLLEHAEETTKHNTGMVLIVAFNYGARNEIMRSVQAIASDVANGKINPEDMTEEMISQHMDTAEYPDPDVIIRTSGEERLSNFLLWQAAYSEFVFRDELWPDFTPAGFDACIEDFLSRNRRYGGLREKVVG
ncbi:MAG: isoprenyl transferase [Stappiaceae bacterium]